MIQLYNETDLLQCGFLPLLISDYISHNNSVLHLIKYPFSFDSFKNIIADKAKDNTDRKLLVQVLQEQYARIATSGIVADNIESLLSEKTFTVTAAHQPCLFGGPLYNIYKIAAAINTANQLNEQFPDNHFVPVFWLGSEDHDVEELNHAFTHDKKIEWTNPGTGASGRWKTDSMISAIEELKAILPSSNFIQILEKGLSLYKTFGLFTQYFFNEIFKEFGLVVIDADNTLLKNKFSSFIKDEIANQRAINVLKNNINFLKENYKIQANPRDINFFYLGENFRERIILHSATGQYSIHNTTITFSPAEIIAEIENHPERFSPNVIFRPLYQEIILPNLAFIGGAGELSYWMELKPMFEFYKVNYPMLILRSSAAIIGPSTVKKLEKLNLKPIDFLNDTEQLINRCVSANINDELNFEKEKKQIEELFNGVVAKTELSDTTLKQTALAEKQKAISSIANLEAKILKAEKRKQETLVNQIRSVYSSLFPNNILQERRENFFPYLESSLIQQMVLHLNPFAKTFKVFTS